MKTEDSVGNRKINPVQPEHPSCLSVRSPVNADLKDRQTRVGEKLTLPFAALAIRLLAYAGQALGRFDKPPILVLVSVTIPC